MIKSVQKYLTLILILLFFSEFGFSAAIMPGEKIQPGAYKSSINTIQIHRKGWKLSYPITELNSGTPLEISFDDLSNQIGNYNYKIIHCNSDWTVSNLNESEYITGFMQNQIYDYEHSFNTYFNYIHYTLELPNEDVQFKISGNYALIVYENFNEEDIVLIKRFMITEGIVSVQANVQRPVMSQFRNNGHQINFEINYGSFHIEDPYSDIKTLVLQNGRWDNMISDLKPLFDRNNVLVYDYQMENVFQAGNEYRWFDIKSMRYQSP